jgi:hypothetical protein
MDPCSFSSNLQKYFLKGSFDYFAISKSHKKIIQNNNIIIGTTLKKKLRSFTASWHHA